MKHLIETTGPFGLLCTQSMQDVHNHRPTVVTVTDFLTSRMAKGEIRLLGELKDEATDVEFCKYWDEAPDIAAASFKSAFGVETPEITKAKKAK